MSRLCIQRSEVGKLLNFVAKEEKKEMIHLSPTAKKQLFTLTPLEQAEALRTWLRGLGYTPDTIKVSDMIHMGLSNRIFTVIQHKPSR